MNVNEAYSTLADLVQTCAKDQHYFDALEVIEEHIRVVKRG